jgi:hypothetical protein
MLVLVGGHGVLQPMQRDATACAAASKLLRMVMAWRPGVGRDRGCWCGGGLQDVVPRRARASTNSSNIAIFVHAQRVTRAEMPT